MLLKLCHDGNSDCGPCHGSFVSTAIHETSCQSQWQTVTSSFVGFCCAPGRWSSSRTLLGWFQVHALRSVVLVVFGVSAGWSWCWLVGWCCLVFSLGTWCTSLVAVRSLVWLSSARTRCMRTSLFPVHKRFAQPRKHNLERRDVIGYFCAHHPRPARHRCPRWLRTVVIVQEYQLFESCFAQCACNVRVPVCYRHRFDSPCFPSVSVVHASFPSGANDLSPRATPNTPLAS